MAEDIIISNYDNEELSSQELQSTYLTRDNALSEFSTLEEKYNVRENLNVYSKSDVQERIVDQVNGEIKDLQLILEQLIQDELANKITNEEVSELLLNYVKRDGNQHFTQPIKGKPATENSHLTTLSQLNQVKSGLASDININKSSIKKVEDSLRNYALKENVYSKGEVYTKKEIDSNNSKYVKKDGSVSFTKPISGITPQISSHLSTKKYVDDVMTNHKSEIDPHGYTDILNNRLKKYALAANVLDKTQTYSRSKIDR